ncbi:hypothetical protein [Pseudomonas sp. BGI-2]|nr:hypothetical protein [Pseudomonas sp. BGI-2]
MDIENATNAELRELLSQIVIDPVRMERVASLSYKHQLGFKKIHSFR